jgi:hypothetical protein
MCNCTSGNLEIPGSMRSLSSGRAFARTRWHRPGNDERERLQIQRLVVAEDAILVEGDAAVA